jgi:hypothetical protein
MLRRNKRGSEQDPIVLFSLTGTVFLLLLAITWIISPMLDNYYVMTDFKIQDLRSDIRVARVINSKECIAYEDDLGHVHPTTLDLSKLSGDNAKDTNLLAKCSSLSNFHMTLKSASDSVVFSIGEDIPEESYNTTLLVRYVDSSDTKTGLLEVVTW